MKKHVSFDKYWGDFWPTPEQLQPYFLAKKGQEWFYTGGNDTAGLSAEGLYGTEGLEKYKERVDVRLSMWGNPQHGVYLQYQKFGGGRREAFASKGDLGRLNEYLKSLHGDPLPIAVFIPFPEAWKAVKEFIQRDGELPTSIAWIANKDLPPNTFPDQ